MSQVIFDVVHQGARLEVVGGWDRPLNYFHLTIYDLDVDNGEDIFWSGLDHFPGGGVSTIGELRDQLNALGIPPPEGFLELCALLEGNVRYKLIDGAWVRKEH